MRISIDDGTILGSIKRTVCRVLGVQKRKCNTVMRRNGPPLQDEDKQRENFDDGLNGYSTRQARQPDGQSTAICIRGCCKSCRNCSAGSGRLNR